MISSKIKFCFSLVILFSCFMLDACFKAEPLNAECDIIKGYIAYNPDIFVSKADTDFYVTNSTAICYVRRGADCSHLAPVFTLTEGATIEPENGSVQDFTHGAIYYTVTSQDGNWSKMYEVSIDNIRPSITSYNFEHYDLDRENAKFYEFYDIDQKGEPHYQWSSGNYGFMLTHASAEPDEYPTFATDEAHSGNHAAKLVTRSTGSFGAMVNKRLAAGNLFLGTFDIQMALTNTLKATRFGVPFDKKPISLTGFYKYKRGDQFQDKDGVIRPERSDSAAIYAVLYKNTDDQGNPICLYGDDVKTSPQIVAIADMSYVAPVSEWTQFSLPFVYSKSLDMELLAKYGYNLTIVSSSSKGGDEYEGAIGSTLMIDDFKIEY